MTPEQIKQALQQRNEQRQRIDTFLSNAYGDWDALEINDFDTLAQVMYERGYSLEDATTLMALMYNAMLNTITDRDLHIASLETYIRNMEEEAHD